MNKFLKSVGITAMVLVSILFLDCKSVHNYGVIDKDVPMKEQCIVKIYGSYNYFSYGDIDLLNYTRLNVGNQLILPAGKTTITASWTVVVNRQIISRSQYYETVRITTRGERASIEYDFLPGGKYEIYIAGEGELRIYAIGSAKPKDTYILDVYGGPLMYTGYMYPNTFGQALGLKRGVEIISEKTDVKITGEWTVGYGFLFKHIHDNYIADLYNPDSAIFAMSFPYTLGLKSEFMVTPDFGLTFGGGITSALVAGIGGIPTTEAVRDYGSGGIRVDEGGGLSLSSFLVPTVPYIQAQINFRNGRSAGYPGKWLAGWSLYAHYYVPVSVIPIPMITDYYPSLPTKSMSPFGVGILLVDW